MELDADKSNMGALLTGSVYVVPSFQRDYSWSEPEWEFFWADLSAAVREQAEHFMGSILVTKSFVDETSPLAAQVGKSSVRFLVDGQQRLVTTLLLMAALADELGKSDDTDHRDAREELVRHMKAGPKFKHGGKAIARLTLNDARAQAHFASLLGLADEPKTGKTGRQVARLYGAKKYFASRIHSYTSATSGKGGDPVALVLTLLEHLQLIHLEAGTDSDAFTIFESLNARGEALQVTDLVKNMVMGRARRLMRVNKASRGLDKEIDENWAGMVRTIREGFAERLKTFLRHFWIAEHAFVRETELYREISTFIRPENVTNAASVKLLRRFSSDLRDAAAQYAWLWDGDENSSFDPQPGLERARPYLAGIKAFNAIQVLPVLLAALRSGVPAVDFVRLAEAAESTVIRRSLADQRANVIEREMGRWCEELRTGKDRTRTVASIVEELRDLAGRNQAPETFARAALTPDRARHILLRLENHRRAAEHKELFPFDGGKIDVEHILPKTIVEKDWPADRWGGPEAREEATARIGNFALWASAPNRSIKNATYDCGKPAPNTTKVTCCKRHAYEKSDVVLTRELAETHLTWDATNLDARQKHLALGAEKVWSYRSSGVGEPA